MKQGPWSAATWVPFP